MLPPGILDPPVLEPEPVVFSIFHNCEVLDGVLDEHLGQKPWCLCPREDQERGGYPEEQDWGDPDTTPHLDWSHNLADRLQGDTRSPLALMPDPILDVVDPIVNEGGFWFSLIVDWVGQRSPDTLREFYQRMQDRSSAGLFRFPPPDDRHTPAFLLHRGDLSPDSRTRAVEPRQP